MFTPIQKIDTNNNNFYIKRDDLLPFSFGGNKVRIAYEFLSDMKKKNKNCMIAYGNARSNLCRVIANLCSVKKIPCHIISPSDDDGQRVTTNNSLLSTVCGAIFHYCTKDSVSETVEKVMYECTSDGLSPYYIYGDKFGRGNEAVPVGAYAKVYKEIQLQEQELGMDFDYIFTATGTGMTQAGLIVGQACFGGDKKISGISVAKNKEQEIPVIEKYLSEYYKSNNISLPPPRKNSIILTDDFIFGGHGQYDINIVNLIKEMYILYGIPLDTTYTGKAFYGMRNYINYNGISKKIFCLYTRAEHRFS